MIYPGYQAALTAAQQQARVRVGEPLSSAQALPINRPRETIHPLGYAPYKQGRFHLYRQRIVATNLP